jgi:hypothetical protein
MDNWLPLFSPEVNPIFSDYLFFYEPVIDPTVYFPVYDLNPPLMQAPSSDPIEKEKISLPVAPETTYKPERGGVRIPLVLPPPEILNDPNLMGEYRRERNCMNARKSRERRKEYMRQLEATCNALERHNEDLTKELMKAQKKISRLTNKQ